MNKIGLIFGGIFGVLSFVNGYFSMQGMYGTWTAFFLTLALLIVLLVVAAIQYKKNNEGFASFGELLRLFFVITFIGTILGMLLSYIYMNTMSDEAMSAMLDRIIETQMNMYESMGMDEATLSKMSDELENKRDELYTPSTMAIGSIMNMFLYFLVSLIPAAILKKNY